ncbi:vacuolar protein sorting-associated protein 13D [Platysternon megacephalum]|uniref:Vacuolar protein sorting-associated protein 13D n=1 Tax=Platysternon megacephalum TaxID=55544 RepID=A0A4D9F805_9SAUR|nr:vacuolar protein sorting-associated protein 13D [Platysternon megacephalum]
MGNRWDCDITQSKAIKAGVWLRGSGIFIQTCKIHWVLLTHGRKSLWEGFPSPALRGQDSFCISLTDQQKKGRLDIPDISKGKNKQERGFFYTIKQQTEAQLQYVTWRRSHFKRSNLPRASIFPRAHLSASDNSN